jgi:D-alanyl-D-alanine carboxypeptidase/D-alanyl-D-alanine-endopeptidase (penicillin-binding protein 4)
VLLAALAASSGCAARTTPSNAPDNHRRTDPRSAAAVRQLRIDLGQIFGTRMADRGVWGVDIRSLQTGEVLFQHDAGKLMMPASNLKILTLAAAAETLGWDYRFTTTLETSGRIEGGVLHGDLIVRGGGDPTINGRDERAARVREEWIAALTAAGIHGIDGRIVGDDNAFDEEGIGAGWAWDYLQYGYAAPVGALQYNEDTAALTITPGAEAGAPASVQVDPGAGFVLMNRAVTGPPGSQVTVDYRRRLDQPLLEISGSVPLGGAAVVRAVSVVNPTVFFVESLRRALQSRGIDVTGPAVDFDDVAPELATGGPREPPRVLVSTMSPPLREIAVVLMKVSQNLYAETLLKATGAAQGGLGTVAAGQNVVRQVMTAWGVPADSYVAVDGSGLSRYNYVAAETLTAVLAHMYGDARHREALMAALPIAGKDGTLSARLKQTHAEGNAVAKTGSISNARSLSGFVRTRDGEMLVFSILANDFVIPSATINWIADTAVETLANFRRQ